MLHAARLVFAFVAVTWLAATPVSAADKLMIAVGQREIWHGAPAALGERAGIFRRYDLDLELLFTSGSGETMQATFAGSVNIGVAAPRARRSASSGRNRRVRIRIGMCARTRRSNQWPT